MHLLVLESFAHSLPCGESLVRKLTTALPEKVFFSQFVSLHCHLSLCISQMAPLSVLSVKSFFHFQSLRSLSTTFLSLLFQYRQVKSLEVLQRQFPLHTCWISMACFLVCVISYLGGISINSSITLCHPPPALLKTHLCLGAQREGDNR